MHILTTLHKHVYILLLLPAFLFANNITPAADRPEVYLPLLKGKNVALVVNQSSRVGHRHLVDFLLSNKIKVKKIFAPEHGFRGNADAGAHVKNSRDIKTGLPIVSLYGKHKKPGTSDLKGIDVILFDIQDVGVRFYTYLSTLHYVMEAAAQHGIPVILLDRPNPNGYYIDGPVLKKKYASFVGLHPVPVVYGMTIGEYARMINGERWLHNGIHVNLKVILLLHYTHQSSYTLPVKPSPNLPNERAVLLYPSLAFFEGTVISAGRGTTKPFQLYGAAGYQKRTFSFVPRSRPGATYPKYKGQRCYGEDLSHIPLKKLRAKKQINLAYLIDAYKNYPDKKSFFLKSRFMDKLAGSDLLRKQISAGVSEKEIRQSWQKDLRKFKEIRKKYLLYP